MHSDNNKAYDGYLDYYEKKLEQQKFDEKVIRIVRISFWTLVVGSAIIIFISEVLLK